ncbi:HAMP domain-containing sensor histidine kinase [Chryseobacterium sp.]|uniref:sensor histidine kinase n=1 Tax=Chryseobacterium sp. TaxID=1871047 RepID=UPI0012C49A77|nr:HAMP domain-containing sensor histidine kinase [Chryseobacterium sp.]MPS64994.1 HAMP domain-containing histidine kinase [Chryseobacterium sp.]
MLVESLNVKSRKTIHYALIICILLIQLLIAGYFYNEFIHKKNLAFIENQLKDVRVLEGLTDNSRKELLNAQDYLQKYVTSNDSTFLNSYLTSLSKLGKNLDSIGYYENKYVKLKNTLALQKKDSLQIKKLKEMIDSTYQFSTESNLKPNNNSFKIQKYTPEYHFDKFDLETKTYTDTVKKKGLFGRLGDAISGKETVRKDSTVVTLKQRKVPVSSLMKSDFDSIMNVVNNHYSREVKKIQVNVTNRKTDRDKIYTMFSNLLVYSNGLMNIYESAIKESKSSLEKEYEKQNSKNNQVRKYLIFGAMILMFIVSILIMLLTRIAFIYERKLNEANQQIKENLNFKNRILGMLSHELRSPLKIIDLFITRINKRTDDKNIKEYLKSISFTNNALLIQANQILEYTKNQAVESKLNPVVFNLKSEITSILNAIEPYIETRNNKLIIEENINPDLVVFSDHRKINQVFMNILGNANKFTENGEIKVTVGVEQPMNKNIVSLTAAIKDSGSGISPSDIEKIFEPYYQGVLSEDVENLGAGLGLSLCKEIVELYNGNISVSSELGKGTTVVFTVNLNLTA